MPMTSVSEAVTVKAGLRRSDRQAGRTTDETDMRARGVVDGYPRPTAPPPGRAGHDYSERLGLAPDLRDVLRCRAFLALHRVELDAITLGERLEAAALNR